MRPSRTSLLLAILGLAAGAGARWLNKAESSAAPQHVAADIAAAAKASGAADRVAGMAADGGAKDRSRVASGFSGQRRTPGEILNLRGMERSVRFGEWLCDAGTEELRDFIKALTATPVEGSSFADAIFLRWAELDVQEAVAWGSAHGYALMAWWSWGKLDPEAALAAAAERKEMVNGAEALRGIAQINPERARRLMEKYPQFIMRGSLEGMAWGLTRSDPKAAAECSLRTVSAASDGIVSGWAYKDPRAALAWAQGVSSTAQRNRALRAVIGQFESTSPELAGAAIAAMPPGKTKHQLLTVHAGELARRDPAAGIAYARDVPSPGLRAIALASVAGALAAEHPREALALLREEPRAQVDYGPYTTDAPPTQMDVLKAIGRSAPLDALAFTESLGPQATSARAVVFEAWSDADVTQASRWLAAQPAEKRDAACVESLVIHLTREGPDQDPEAAVRWSLSSSSGEGTPGLPNAFQAWHRQNPAAAREALDGPDVPESLRQQLSALLPP